MLVLLSQTVLNYTLVYIIYIILTIFSLAALSTWKIFMVALEVGAEELIRKNNTKEHVDAKNAISSIIFTLNLIMFLSMLFVLYCIYRIMNINKVSNPQTNRQLQGGKRKIKYSL
jgi:uncharacterized membrane protein YccF (DUF307 family)